MCNSAQCRYHGVDGHKQEVTGIVMLVVDSMLCDLIIDNCQTDKNTHGQTHIQTQTDIHAHTHTHKQAQTHDHMYTHTQTQTYMRTSHTQAYT